MAVSSAETTPEATRSERSVQAEVSLLGWKSVSGEIRAGKAVLQAAGPGHGQPENVPALSLGPAAGPGAFRVLV